MLLIRNQGVCFADQCLNNCEFLVFGVMGHVVKIFLGVSGSFIDA